MSMGIGGQDPFKSYASNAEAGGSMGVYIKRRKKNKDSDKEGSNSQLDMEDSDDDNLEVDLDDDFML